MTYEQKRWSVGKKVVGLRPNGCVVIAEEIDNHHEQFTLATGIPGVVGLADTLVTVAEEMKAQQEQARRDGRS